MTVGIIGGGLMGVSLGYFLTQMGATVEVFEATPALGGLAGRVVLRDGTSVDRFYHAILSSDHRLRRLCAELGIEDALHFRETKTGFYYQRKIHPMNNIGDLLRFPPLGWVDRFRFGLTILHAQLVRDWRVLESISAEEWLTRWSGQRTYENIWRPMLKAKFDESFDGVPATYIWARLVRMKSTRNGISQKEEAGHLVGGYSALIEVMARRIEARGGRIHLQSAVEEVVTERGHVQGVRLDGDVRPFDRVVTTLQLPLFRQLIPDANQGYLDSLKQTDYLGIICPLLVMDRPLTGYWTVNITDDRIPFTGVIETTAYIDPRYVGGHHLVYLPKYAAPDSDWQRMSDGAIRRIWLRSIESMFPTFDRSSIYQFLVHREPYVEPLHGLDGMHLIPSVDTPVKGLHLVTTAQIYPELTNGESAEHHSHQAAQRIFERMT